VIVALLAAPLDCLGDDGAYIFDAAPGVVEALLNLLQAFLFGADDEMTELFVRAVICSTVFSRITIASIASRAIYGRVLGRLLLRGSALGMLGHVGRLQF
jgi:hypothetical protein